MKWVVAIAKFIIFKSTSITFDIGGYHGWGPDKESDRETGNKTVDKPNKKS